MTFLRSLYFLVFLATPCFSHLIKTDVLFVLYDMGEAKGLQPLMSLLSKNGKSYKILALGQASEAFPVDSNIIPLPLKKDHVLDWNRSQTLETGLLAFLDTIECKVVISGMACLAQAQILEQFGNKNTWTVAFYDNFDGPETKTYILPFLKYGTTVHELWVPSKQTYDGFDKNFQPFWGQMCIMGQPALESWQHTFLTTDRMSIRQELDIGPETPCVLFVGGYDDTYEEALKVFLEATNLLQTDDVQFLISPHPKTYGVLERKLVDEQVDDVNVLIPHGYSTSELATISHLVICHKSTVGVLALYQGIPVVYVAKKDNYSNFVIQEGQAGQVETPSALVDAILAALSAPHSGKRSFNALGIPGNASRVMFERLLQKMENVPGRKSF